MKNLAPEIYRQRLLIEGFYDVVVTKEFLDEYLRKLATDLDLRIYGEPIIFSPTTGMGKEENSGFDAFVPLIDSGICIAPAYSENNRDRSNHHKSPQDPAESAATFLNLTQWCGKPHGAVDYELSLFLIRFSTSLEKISKYFELYVSIHCICPLPSR